MGERARKRRLRRLIPLLIALLAGLFVPYPTGLSPAVVLQLVDPQGNGVVIRSADWTGGSSDDYFQQRVNFDSQGRLSLPARRKWSSIASRALQLLSALKPHSGGFGSADAGISFDLPSGLEFDANSMNQKPTFDSGYGPRSIRVRCWDLPDGVWRVCFSEGMGDRGQDQICVATDRPGHGGTSTYRIVLRPKSSNRR